jgi:hypothetical protein
VNATVETCAEIVVRRPPAEVASYAMDPSHDTEWIGALTSVRRLDNGPIRRGSQVERVARFLGRRIHYVNEVVEYDPPHALAMRSVKSPFPLRVLYSFTDHPDGTRARIDVSGEPGRFFRVLRPVLRRMITRNIAADLRRLKEGVESAGSSG